MTGPGELIGVGNGDPASHEPDKASKRRAFNGLCLAIVQAGRRPGNIRITAAATGLTPAVATLRAQVAHRRPFVA
jgi:beta-galactosidase